MRREQIEAYRRAIADEKIVSYLDNEVREAIAVLKMIREIIGLLDGMQPARFKTVMEELNKSKESIEIIHRDLLTYISRVSPSLSHREDWLRASYKVRNSVDKLSGVISRLEFLVSRGWAMTPPVKEGIKYLAESVTEMMTMFRKLVNVSLMSPDDALNMCTEVFSKEAEVDSKFRSATFSILSANLSPNTIILLLNIAEMLEDVSDTLTSATEDLYIILLSMRRYR